MMTEMVVCSDCDEWNCSSSDKGGDCGGSDDSS